MPNSIKYSTTGDTQSLRDGNFYIGTGDVGKGPTSSTGHWNGITPPGGGYTVYKNKVSNGPAIWTATSDNQLISLTNNTEGTSFTTIQPCLNYYAAQTDKMVFNKDYEGIITNGLVLNLDAGFIPSYQGSGTTWYDLAYSGNNGTLTNGPTYSVLDGGNIVFDGVDDYTIGSLSNLPIGNSDRTVSGWFKTTRVLATEQYQSVFWYGNLSTNNGFFYSVGGDNNIGGVGAANRFGGSNYGDGIGTPQTVNDGLWKNGVITINNSVWTLYLNGVNVASKTLITDTSNTTYKLGYDGLTFYYQGNIANIAVYNRALSATEVLKNYNAGLARFNTQNIVKTNLLLNLDSTNSVSYPTSGTTWTDLSGYGNKGTLTNGPTFNSTSKSISFDGVDDYVTIPTFSIPVASFTCETFFLWSNLGSDRGSLFALNYNYPTSGYLIRQKDDGTGKFVVWSDYGSESGIYSTNSLTANVWNHVVVAQSNGTCLIYINGVLDSSQSLPNPVLNQIYPVLLGTRAPSGPSAGAYLSGNISKSRIYNRVLSQSEVLQNYYGSPIVTSGLLMVLDAGNLVSYSGAGTTWKDLTTNGKNGTLTNGPTYSSTNGGSIVFDGSDDYLITPTITNFRTISLWIKTSNTGGGWRYLIDARPGMGSGWYTGFESGGGVGSNWVSQYVNGSPTTVAFSNITLGTWCNLVVISDAPYTSTINFMSRFSNAEMLNGSIGNIMIYNKVLSADEVAQNYNAQKSRFGL